MLHDIPEVLKKRFCKDENISINVFREPYFTDRLELFGCLENYKKYIDMLTKRFHITTDNNPQDYLECYGKIKDDIIDYIKASATYNSLQNEDMQKFAKKTNYPNTELYKEYNVGHKFISIDIRKANFTALVHYGKTSGNEFYKNYNYDEFIRQFTDIEHIINSKYIRQVVFGNCNPKRQINYEMHMTEALLDRLLKENLIKEDIIKNLKNDEIILDADHLSNSMINDILKHTHKVADFPVAIEFFKLGKIIGSQAYIKDIYASIKGPVDENENFDTIWENTGKELKCVNPDEAPFIYRTLLGDKITDNDMVFSHDNKLAKFLEIPSMSISYEQIR